MKKLSNPALWNRSFYIGVAVSLLALNLLGPNGLLHGVRLHQEAARLARRRTELEVETTRMRSDIEHFRHSRTAQERAIREELGYLKSDEISVEISP